MQTRFRPASPIALALAAAFTLAPVAARADEAALMRRIEQLAGELEAVKAEMAKLKAATPAAGTGTAVVNGPAPVVNGPAPVASAPASNGLMNGAPAVMNGAEVAAMPAASSGMAVAEEGSRLTSYGEINYNRYRNDSARSQTDVRRVVLGYEHRFDPKTKAVVELEWEHAVTSADDQGEAAVEQAYIEHQFNDTVAGRAGLFLIPLGLLNERHEPTTYYGVERNFVETAIIPTTWREAGAQAVATLDNGLTLQGGVSTGFDIGKWDATSDEGVVEGPLGAIHQEGQLAKSRDMSVFGAVNWRGVPGLHLGGGFFTGGASQGAVDTPRARVTLWETHARWQPGAWDFAALYAAGRISNTAALNAPLVGGVALIPARFDGGYLQAANRVWESGGQYLSPFVRVERYNTGKDYAWLGAGVTPARLPNERVITVGANYGLSRSVVLKADMQWFKETTANNRIDLGVGWAF
ncbi:porin [Derxia gummosa]|uniref:Porin n=1 Tax=Derxia gummosa DSM 723 TaxID=1121388 RepID=A0A8B6XA35_9BURK|nr:porin [Derxia gummosa]